MKEKQKIAKIALFRTFKTQKELIDYFNMHTPEERRLLYMGAAFMNNLIAYHLEKDES